MSHWTTGVHHDGSALFVSNLLPKMGETVAVRVRVPAHAPVLGIFLRICPDGEPAMSALEKHHSDTTSAWWQGQFKITMPLNTYRFKITSPEGAYFLNGVGISRAEAPDQQDFKILADFAAPSWVTSAVFYEIFPDRFHNGDPATNVKPGEWSRKGHATQLRPWGTPPLSYAEGGNLDFFGGDLEGIRQKLDYLDDLGVNALYLTPIFDARTNHRYDIIDFYNVDAHLGGNDALQALRQAMTAKQMRLILDVTLNHTGNSNPWFTAAQASIDAPTAEYFTFYQHPDQYEMWLGIASLVKFNYRSENLRQRLYKAPDSVLRKWLQPPYQIDGWRLDVANMQAKQGEHQLGNEVGQQIRAAVKDESPDAYLFGEHFHDGTPHLQGDEIDASMNYLGFTFPVWRWLVGHDLGMDWGRLGADPIPYPAETLDAQWANFRGVIPWAVARQQFNLLGSHDTLRFLSVAKNDEALFKLGMLLMLTYVGVPCLYYGDEIGMAGGNDPANRACMIWDEAAWNTDLRNYCKQLIAWRRTLPALAEGGYQTLLAEGPVLAYQRVVEGQHLLVVAAREAAPNVQILAWRGGLADGVNLRDKFSGQVFQVAEGKLSLGNLAHGAGLLLEVI
jgi:alpha-glucosidase